MRVSVPTLLLLGVAACGYRGGSFQGPRGPFVGERTTVGCLDVAVDTHADAAAEGPVLAFEFGNRCDRPSPVDLTALVVRGRTSDGHEVALTAWDPEGVLAPRRLEARRTGREVIEFRGAHVGALRMACVELRGVAGASRAHVGAVGKVGGPGEVCLDLAGAAVAEVSP